MSRPTIPKTESPETDRPETDSAETAPETQTDDTGAVASGEVQVPEAADREAPDTAAANSETPKGEAPDAGTPDSTASDGTAPDHGAPDPDASAEAIPRPVAAPGERAGQVDDADIAERVAAAVTAADDRQAQDLKVLDLAGVSDFTDYFLICSGANDRQVQAIAEAVDAALRERKVRPLHQEGTQSGRWVLLDYGDFIVHVFRDETRRFYGLERLWGDAPEVTERFRA